MMQAFGKSLDSILQCLPSLWLLLTSQIATGFQHVPQKVSLLEMTSPSVCDVEEYLRQVNPTMTFKDATELASFCQVNLMATDLVAHAVRYTSAPAQVRHALLVSNYCMTGS